MEKTKILHIVSNLNCGGAETMIMNIYRNINKEQFQFEFLCLNSINGSYEKEILQMGGKIHKINTKNNIKKIKKIYSFLKKNKYDVIHSHVMFYSGIIMLLAYLCNIKLRIVHSHSSGDMKRTSFKRIIYMNFSRILINLFSNVKISCSELAGTYLYGENKKYIILKNGIDLDNYKNISLKNIKNIKEQLFINDKELIIGHVGNFLKVKNQKYFIDLAKCLLKKKIIFKIVLVGSGKEYENISNLINKENLNDYFILLGLRSDINILMHMFDIFVMPSLYEGFPLSVVEALAGNNICFPARSRRPV